jgi:RNA polymerase sigma factor (sigma-70 family)
MIQETQLATTQIEAILAKPGRSWSFEERKTIVDWLFPADPYDLGCYAIKFLRSEWPRLPLDVANEAFSSFLGRRLDRLLSLYDPDLGNLKGYLRFCLRRHCQSCAFRQWKKDVRQADLTEEVGNLGSVLATSIQELPDRRLEQREVIRTLPKVFGRLSDQHRQALMMRAEGKSYEEIARDLGVSLAVVKNRLHRARLQLRRELAEIRTGCGI